MTTDDPNDPKLAPAVRPMTEAQADAASGKTAAERATAPKPPTTPRLVNYGGLVNRGGIPSAP